MSQIAENLEKVREQIHSACDRAGRSPGEVTLVAVTKNVPVERILEAVDCGIEVVGENRVQEARQKRPNVSREISWHLIGHLQTNKVRYCPGLFEVIQSVDSLRLAREISSRYSAAGSEAQIMIEVNISREPNKFGVDPQDVLEFSEQVAALPGIKLIGLMAIAPFFPDPERTRPYFRSMKALWEKLANRRLQGVELKYLSMGMTNDFEVAIEEGSTMIRVGTGIFGQRQ